MAGDIRLILALLQQTLNSSRESSSIEMMPGTAPAGTTRPSVRAPALVQRSASEPQPQTVPPSTSNNGNGKLQPSTSHSLFRQEIFISPSFFFKSPFPFSFIFFFIQIFFSSIVSFFFSLLRYFSLRLFLFSFLCLEYFSLRLFLFSHEIFVRL